MINNNNNNMSEVVDSGPEKSNNNNKFSEIFNLLSQYLKENGSLGDFNHGWYSYVCMYVCIYIHTYFDLTRSVIFVRDGNKAAKGIIESVEHLLCRAGDCGG